MLYYIETIVRTLLGAKNDGSKESRVNKKCMLDHV